MWRSADRAHLPSTFSCLLLYRGPAAISTQRELNPHFRHGKPAGYRYIMGANVLIELSKNKT